MVTEDSNSGYQFWLNVFKSRNVVSSGGNGNLIKQVKNLSGGISIWLPESFEYLILKSGILKSEKLTQILDNIPEYVDCEKYESWENFFTDLLVMLTSEGVEKYSKSTLNTYYLQDWAVERIKGQLPEEIRI